MSMSHSILMYGGKNAMTGPLRNDSNDVGYCAAELFSLADCYTSSPNRDGSDLDENELKIEVKKTLEKYNFLKKE
ncbi:hypothetical protein FR965_05880 [Serratia marcescens]|nr:hypothetical protein FR965_05880 [Serratia marcescens]